MHKSFKGFFSLGLSLSMLGMFFLQKGNIVNCIAGTMAYSMQMMTATAFGEAYSFPEATSTGDKWAQDICTVMLKTDDTSIEAQQSAQDQLQKIMDITGTSDINELNDTQELIDQYTQNQDSPTTEQISGGWM